ncbi:MFS transporter [Vibrio sp. JC009]|uniref:MFS transporter n=1 Tax=Vibrio sp. JC009 TaxID=2912314 RepID=UPI0023AE918C|nr:MFS transporter [Vibrio sp. JC009]WED23801.1 MFS transporter [Vibrio sp. JC009]
MNTTTQRISLTYGVGLTLLAGFPLFTLPPLGLDIFLPSVHQIGEFFGSHEVPTLAISVYMLFLGLGQLFWGGMADALGKKNIALIGLVIFTISSYMISILTQDESLQFLLLRALQSFGGSAGFTAIFAIVRTRFDGEILNKAYSYLNGILALVPVSAPLVGAYIAEHNAWFTLFTVMAVLGGISFIWIMLSLPNDRSGLEVKSEQSNREDIFHRYLSVIVNTRFRTYLFFALIAQSLFIYILTVAPMYLMGKLGTSQVAFGQMFMIIALVFMSGSFLSPKLSVLLSTKALIALSLSLIVLGGVVMFSLSNILAWYSLILPLVIVATGCTILMSSSPAKALADFKESAGIASGLYTATTFGAGALLATLFAMLADSTDLTQVALVYTLSGLFALAIFALNKTVRR